MPAHNFCVDCVASGTRDPRRPTGQSRRCAAHRRQRDNYLARNRNAWKRHRAGGGLGPAPVEPAAWEAAYRPAPLAAQRDLVTVLDADDLEQIVGVLQDLREAQLSASNAERSGSPTAIRRALRDLLDRTYEATETLGAIPGIAAEARPRRMPQ